MRVRKWTLKKLSRSKTWQNFCRKSKQARADTIYSTVSYLEDVSPRWSRTRSARILDAVDSWLAGDLDWGKVVEVLIEYGPVILEIILAVIAGM